MIEKRKVFRLLVNLIKIRVLALPTDEVDEREIKIAQALVDLVVPKSKDLSVEGASAVTRLTSGFIDTVYTDKSPLQFVENVAFEADHLDDNIIDQFEMAVKYTVKDKEGRRQELMNMTQRAITDEVEIAELNAKLFKLKLASTISEKKYAFKEFTTLVHKIEDKRGSTSHESVSHMIDIENEEDVSRVFDTISEDNDALLLKTGFKGLNVQLQGGMKRGEMVCIAADSHNYKSGLALTTFISMLLDNEPPKVKEGKRPTAVWYSLEDSIHHVFNVMYKYVYHYYEDKAPPEDLTSADKAKYVKEKLTAKGWSLLVFKADPTVCDWDTPLNVLKGVMAKGHEIIMAGIDYIPLLPTKGLEGSGGTELRQLIRNYKNFGARNNMLIISPLQASPAANGLESEGVGKLDKCKVMARRNMTAGSRQIIQELDTLFFIDKIIHEGVPLLVVVMTKHKNTNVIADYKKTIILRFMLNRPIIGDLNKKENEYWHKLEDVPVESATLQEDSLDPF